MKFDIDINESYKEVSITIKAPEMSSEVAQLMSKLQKEKTDTISGKYNQKIYILNYDDILLFYSEDGKIIADTLEGSYEISKKLYEIEEELLATSFIRISKSAIVNIKRIQNIEVFFNGSLVVKFANGHEEIISRRFVGKVKEFIGLGGKL